MKKSYAAARARAFRLSLAYSSISCGWMTRSATARAFRASSPEANTQTRIGLPRPFGRTTSSSTRFFGTDRSTSRRFTATSTDSLNSRGFAASRSFLIVSTECLSAKGNRLLQCARPTEPPARGRRRKSVALIRLCGPRALHGSCGRSAADEALPPHRGSFAVRARDHLNYQRPADNARNAFVAGFPSRPDAGGGHRAGARDARPHRERRAGLSGPGAERRVNRSSTEGAPRGPVARRVSHPPIAPDEGLGRSVPRAAESIPSPRTPDRSGGGPTDERRRPGRRGGDRRGSQGELALEGTRSRDGCVDLQRGGIDRTQAPGSDPLEQRPDPLRESVPRRGGDPPPLVRRTGAFAPSRSGRPERIEPVGLGGAEWPPGADHARAVSFPGAASFDDATRAHLCLSERPGSVHPELVLSRRRVRGGQTPGTLGRRHGFRPDPARGDALGPRAPSTGGAEGPAEGPVMC